MEIKSEVRMAAAANYYARRWGTPVPEMTPAFTEIVIARWRYNAVNHIVAIPPRDTDPTHAHPARPIREHQSGMPDADYFKSLARAEFGWNHRMESDPFEGFDR